MNTAFAQSVFAAVRQIPYGETRTYREIANKARRPRACRAVGNILNSNTDPGVPCHRVIRSDGSAGGYNRGTAAKIRLLKSEGVRVG